MIHEPFSALLVNLLSLFAPDPPPFPYFHSSTGCVHLLCPRPPTPVAGFGTSQAHGKIICTISCCIPTCSTRRRSLSSFFPVPQGWGKRAAKHPVDPWTRDVTLRSFGERQDEHVGTGGHAGRDMDISMSWVRMGTSTAGDD